MVEADGVFLSAWLDLVSVLVSIRVRRLPQVRADLGGHASQHVAGDMLVPLGERRSGLAHDLHRDPVGYTELKHCRGGVPRVM
jgi:hypothetical protein